MKDKMIAELKPNITAYILGVIITLGGVVLAIMVIGGFFINRIIGIIIMITMLPFAWMMIRTGISLLVKRVQAYEDEIIIKEFLSKDIHIPANRITSYENIEARDVMKNVHRKYMRWVTIFCSDEKIFFEYNQSAVSGEAELMEYLSKYTHM